MRDGEGQGARVLEESLRAVEMFKDMETGDMGDAVGKVGSGGSGQIERAGAQSARQTEFDGVGGEIDTRGLQAAPAAVLQKRA